MGIREALGASGYEGVTVKVACIGTGVVGHAWAVVFARAGHDVSLYDAKPDEVISRALPGARLTLELLDSHGMLSEPVETVAARLTPAATIAEAVRGAGYVQESVREDIETKRAVVAEIAAAVSADAILASSTSAIPGSAFLTGIPHPGRALVVHPVNPPSLIPLVEICGTGETTADVVRTTREFMTDCGMRPIVLNKEIDGFILNRLQFTLVAEALHLVGEGYCSPQDVDAVLTEGLALRWASIGPFEVAHLNAREGVQGFVDRLGPMMRRLGGDAQTNYNWSTELIGEIHDHLVKRIPLAQIEARQQWRDSRILALRQLKELGQTETH